MAKQLPGPVREDSILKLIVTMAVALTGCAIVLAADTSTNDILTTLASKLQTLMVSLDPRPEVTISPTDNAIHVIYLPQTNKIHRIRSKRYGDISSNTVDEIGPAPTGFLLYVGKEPKGSPHQLMLPQAGCDILPIDGTNQQLFWRLYPGHKADSALMKNIVEIIREMEYFPNQQQEDTARKLADPQH